MMQFNDNYELNDIEKRRVRPLLNEVLERSISFKYFTTIVYHKRKTNYDHVLEDNRVFKHLLRKFFKADLRMMFFIEKHSHPTSKHYLGYHRHILLEDIPSSRWMSPTPRMRKFLEKISPDALYTVSQNSEQSELYKLELINHAIRICSSVPNGHKGLDVRPIHDIEKLLAYCTKQCTNISSLDVLDAGNSDFTVDNHVINNFIEGSRSAKPPRRSPYQKIAEDHDQLQRFWKSEEGIALSKMTFKEQLAYSENH